MVKAISILGSSGSIGRQTVAVAQRLNIPVKAISVRSDIKRAEEQARLFHPELVAVFEEDAAAVLRQRLSELHIPVLSGEEGLTAAATVPGADCVVTAVSGAIGLKPTLAAIDAGRRIALANKETLVCAGSIVMQRATEKNAEILPVDSEHSAIFQCLMGRAPGELKKILLTGSGGPFRGKPLEQLKHITPEQAVKHPNWSMGAKISIDSATMMNKGLEFIEAMHLFHCTPDEIQIIVHPESIIHSMVELVDGAVIAQLGSRQGFPGVFFITSFLKFDTYKPPAKGRRAGDFPFSFHFFPPGGVSRGVQFGRWREKINKGGQVEANEIDHGRLPGRVAGVA